MASVLVRNKVVVSGTPGGRPMVFAHGFGCDQSMWRYVVPEFEPDHLVVTFDHVGFGGSDVSAWSRDRYPDLGAYADDLVEILTELDLYDVVLVGHSVAATIGILASVRHPERFGQLVLVGPSPRYVDDPATGYRGGFSAADIDELLETLDSNYMGWSLDMAPVIMGNPDRPELGAELSASFCRVSPEVADAFARLTFLSDNRADLAEVQLPTLILQCRDDPIAPEVVGNYVHDHIPGSTLVQLAATGHCPNLSAPAETARTIRAYLDSTTEPARRPSPAR
ncbi:alpha/beta hydrolase [Jatrophihabitans telluris]|uniref:Alpha/beta hydrolase n=1 Tax=Jatrophihabitans telluris TaxID=2038343 RepID=A0ABY4QYR6_9ACTN|nr:alpha/beta hydrolase [Jatrophihabitans telluris]UQX88453.1 alpha/beta hydrolase [Jatrophihabitans telluris]